MYTINKHAFYYWDIIPVPSKKLFGQMTIPTLITARNGSTSAGVTVFAGLCQEKQKPLLEPIQVCDVAQD